MKNNNENKARFFAQYYGQKVLMHPVYPEPQTIHGKSFMPELMSGSQYLQLRSLSSITNEEAIEVAKIFNKYSNAIEYKIEYKVNTFNDKFAQWYWMDIYRYFAL